MKKFIAVIIFLICTAASAYAVPVGPDGLQFELRIDKTEYFIDCERVRVSVAIDSNRWNKTVFIEIQNKLHRMRHKADTFRHQFVFNGHGQQTWGGPKIPRLGRMFDATFEVTASVSDGRLVHKQTKEFRAKLMPIPYVCRNP